MADGFVDGGLELHFVAAAIRGVLSEDGDTLRIVDAIDDGVGGKSAEDDGVDGANASTGQNGNGEFRRHAHVDGDAIALLDSKAFQSIRKSLDLGKEIAIGETPNFARLAFPQDGRLVGTSIFDVPIDAVVAEIELASDKPLRPRQIPVQHLLPGREPVQFAGDLAPEGVRIGNGALVHLLVFGEALDVRALRKLLRRGKNAVFAQGGI